MAPEIMMNPIYTSIRVRSRDLGFEADHKIHFDIFLCIQLAKDLYIYAVRAHNYQALDCKLLKVSSHIFFALVDAMVGM